MTMTRVLVLSVAVAAALGCEDNVGLEDDNPARSGAVQPKGNGSAVDEEEACTAYRNALEQRATDLNCPKPVECPDLIRPAGGDACLQYDQGTVEACVTHVGRYATCAEFTRSPCIVSTVPGSTSAGCTPPLPDAGSDSGDAGGDGAAGAPGDSGLDAPADSATDTGSAGMGGGGGSSGVDAGGDAATDAASAGAAGTTDAGGG